MRWIIRAALAVAALGAIGAAAFLAIGGREGLILTYARLVKPHVEPNREVVWEAGPESRPRVRANPTSS